MFVYVYIYRYTKIYDEPQRPIALSTLPCFARIFQEAGGAKKAADPETCGVGLLTSMPGLL